MGALEEMFFKKIIVRKGTALGKIFFKTNIFPKGTALLKNGPLAFSRFNRCSLVYFPTRPAPGALAPAPSLIFFTFFFTNFLRARENSCSDY